MFTIVPDIIYYIFIVLEFKLYVYLFTSLYYIHLCQINVANDNHNINIKQIIIIHTLFSDSNLQFTYL